MIVFERNTDNHPLGTMYDVLVPGHAARRRSVVLSEALQALNTMRSEGIEDVILVAHFPDGKRVPGCTGSWEN